MYGYNYAGVNMAANSQQQLRPRIAFKPLDWSRGELRFLEIQPASNIEKQAVCRIVTLPLDDTSEFVAISTLVGDITQTEKVIINNSTVPIPVHVAQALRHVRAVFAPSAFPRRNGDLVAVQQQQPSRSPRWLQAIMRTFGAGSDHNREAPLRIWMDCLCLNTEDPRERAKHKAIIASVYWRAKTVVGWLGLKSEYTDAGIALIRDFDEHMPEAFNEPEDRELHPENYSPHHVWSKPIVHHFDASAGAAVGTADFLSRDFFRRNWILEEMACAQAPSFLIGDAIVSFDQLLRVNLAMEEFKDYESNVCPAETRPLIHQFPLETIHVLSHEMDKRKNIKLTDSWKRNLTPSIRSGEVSEPSTGS